MEQFCFLRVGVGTNSLARISISGATSAMWPSFLLFPSLVTASQGSLMISLCACMHASRRPTVLSRCVICSDTALNDSVLVDVASLSLAHILISCLGHLMPCSAGEPLCGKTPTKTQEESNNGSITRVTNHTRCSFLWDREKIKSLTQSLHETNLRSTTDLATVCAHRHELWRWFPLVGAMGRDCERHGSSSHHVVLCRVTFAITGRHARAHTTRT